MNIASRLLRDVLKAQSTRVLTAFGVIVALVLAGSMLSGLGMAASICWAAELGPGAVADQDPEAALITATITEKLAKLDLPPKATETTPEKALVTRDAIKARQFNTARQIVSEVLENSRLELWQFHPFRDFISDISDVNDPTFESDLSEWVTQSPGDAIPVLLRAQYYFDLAWYKRGGKFAKDTSETQFRVFIDYLNKAAVDVDTAIHLNDQILYTASLKFRILQGLSSRPEMYQVFENAIKRYPGYYPLYDLVLRTLEPRWWGTPAKMREFVDKYAGDAPEHSPLRLLYLALYRSILESASIACNNGQRDLDKLKECVAAYMGQNVDHALEQQVEAALRLYDYTDKYQFGIALRPMLIEMLRTKGGDVYSGAILQLAATAMQSSTQLEPTASKAGNYIIDQMTAESWYQKRFYDNAITKYKQALADARVSIFPNVAEDNLSLGEMYNNLAFMAGVQHQYIDMIVYEKAAIAISGLANYRHAICYAYFQLKQPKLGVKECTEIIKKTNNLLAHYWRARSYRALGAEKEALQDFQVVADSEHNFRADAAIQMSVIYEQMHDFHAALEVLNKYTYLYDAKRTLDKNNIAASYNNRCYAYMELGELQKALDDCTASLRYGSLPEAYRKQQELVRRLKAQ